jgi:hypothetical protein
LKLGTLTKKHLTQLESYLESKDIIVKKIPDILNGFPDNNPKWIGIMVGKTIDHELMTKITEGHYYKEIPVTALTINRFRGQDGSIYVITDTYFPGTVKGKDYTKYEFNERTYGKGRLVLAVVKYYMERNPNTKFSELKNKFSNNQGMVVLATEAEARKLYEEKKYKRHFLNSGEIIQTDDKTFIAVSNQWGKNIKDFIILCKNKLQIEIKEIKKNNVKENMY